MSLPSDTAPGHLPPAATPPWPAHPAPREPVTSLPVAAKEPAAPAIPVGLAIAGGVAAAAIGLLIAIPLFRKPSPPPRRRGRPRKKTT